MSAKKSDCVEMKRVGAHRVYEEIKGLSFDEEVAYWRRQNEMFHAERKKLRETAQNQANHRRISKSKSKKSA